eukprot:scaffold7912_cov31-Phaeocystis_antarctica.AAC.1
MARATPDLYATQCDEPFLAAAAAMIARGGACASDFKLVRGCTTLPLTTHPHPHPHPSPSPHPHPHPDH